MRRVFDGFFIDGFAMVIVMYISLYCRFLGEC